MTALQPDSIDFQKTVITLRKYKYKILLFAALMTLLVYLGLSAVTPVYRSSATLLINSAEKTSVVSVEELISSEHTSENFLTQIEILRSRQLAHRVVAEMDLTRHWAFNPALEKPPEYQSKSDARKILADFLARFGVADASSERTLDNDNLQKHAVNQLLSKVDIVPVRDTTLVRIKVDGYDPELVSKIANQYGESYIDDILETKVELTGQASVWLDKKLAGIKEKLVQSEARLVEFRESEGILDLGGRVGGLKEQQISVLTERLVDAERERRELRILLDEIDSVIGSVGGAGSEVYLSVVDGTSNRSPLLREYESLSVINTNPLVQRLRLEVLEEERKLEELGLRYGEKHPLVISAQSSLDGAVYNHDIQIERVIDSVRKQLQLAEANLRSLEAKLRGEERATYVLDRKQIEMSQLEREVEANRNLYNTYFKRAKDANEADGIGAVIASISDPATTSSNPVFPRTKFTLQLALILSLLGFSLLALLIEKYRNTVQDVDTIISKLGLPMLGLVPLVRQKNRIRKSRTPVIPGQYVDKSGLFEESFKTIRSSLYLSSIDDKLIMVTSTLPSEGKSTVALNLAYSMSTVEKVLLIEADMRLPTYHMIKNRHLELGLSDHLIHNEELDVCIKKFGSGSNLDILPAGFVPDMPLELLTSVKFKSLLAKLGAQYDRIIIDTAPVGAVSDALMVGQLIDTTVFVTRADSTPIQDVSVSLERLEKAGVKVGGVVISKVDVNRANRYGGGKGYRGYFDTYGYSYGQKASASGVRPGRRRSRYAA